MVLIDTIVPLLKQTPTNPDGVAVAVLDTFRSNVIKDRSQFFIDVPTGPFFGFNRPGAKVNQGLIDAWWLAGMQAGVKATHDTTYSWEVDYTEDLKALDIPVLFIHGDDDQIVPIGASALVGIKIAKHGQIKIYPGGAHALPNLEVDGINNDLLEFIKG